MATLVKRLTSRWSAVGTLLVLVLLAGLSMAAKPSTAAQTGQGIMVNLNASGSFAVVGTQTYKFNEATAATYFTNTWDGAAPTVSCTGSPTNCANPAPAAPAAPASDASKVTGPSGTCQAQRCTFLDGGTLLGSSYTQAVSVVVGSGSTKRTYTYTYTYNVTPTTNPVEPFTAWDLVSDSTGGTAHVAITAVIAGESALKKGSDLKYSFSLLNSDGTSRVQDLVVTVDGTPIATGSSLAYPVDFAYTTNAGSNGNTSLLVDGDARTILNTDTFLGNNDGGADGSALALAKMDAVGADLAPGDHTVTLTGTVKGNGASADIGFTITQTIHVITPGCGAG